MKKYSVITHLTHMYVFRRISCGENVLRLTGCGWPSPGRKSRATVSPPEDSQFTLLFIPTTFFYFFFQIDSSPRVGLYPDCARLIVQLSNPTVTAFRDLSSYMTTTRRQVTFASFKHVKIFSRGHIVTPCLRIDKQMYLRMTESKNINQPRKKKEYKG